jgi:hypothetical protein
MPGVPTKGELFDFADWELGRLADFPTVFAAGNIVTGKGNIVASRKHATQVSEAMAAAYLGLDDGAGGREALADAVSARAAEAAAAVAEGVVELSTLEDEAVERVLARVRERQAAVGYDSDLAAWIAKVTPADFE